MSCCHGQRAGPGKAASGHRAPRTFIRCYNAQGRCYTLDLSQVGARQPVTREIIKISDPAVKDAPAFAAAAGAGVTCCPGARHSVDQIEADA